MEGENTSTVCKSHHVMTRMNQAPHGYTTGFIFCDDCRKHIIPSSLMGQHFYHCQSCRYDLCMICSQWPRNQRARSVDRAATQVSLPMTCCQEGHDMDVLTSKPSQYTGTTFCDNCRTIINIQAGFRHCDPCNFDLCPNCCNSPLYVEENRSSSTNSRTNSTNSRRTRETYCKSRHMMGYLTTKPAEYMYPGVICDECRGRITVTDGFAHCSLCSFDLCGNCSSMIKYSSPVQAVCPRMHNMEHLTRKPTDHFMLLPVRCSHCDTKIVSASGYEYCSTCKFSLCPSCVSLPNYSASRQQAMASIHSYCRANHTMIYMTTCPTDYAGIAGCDHCRRPIDYSLGFTHCEPCGFDLCNHCFKLSEFASPATSTTATVTPVVPLATAAEATYGDDDANVFEAVLGSPAPPAELPERVYCNSGHESEHLHNYPNDYKNLPHATGDVLCDSCGVAVDIPMGFFHCSLCQFDICKVCVLGGNITGLGVNSPVHAIPLMASPTTGSVSLVPPTPPLAAIDSRLQNNENLPGLSHNLTMSLIRLTETPSSSTGVGTTASSSPPTHCLSGHELEVLRVNPASYKNTGSALCDVCRKDIVTARGFCHCARCSFDICPDCYERFKVFVSRNNT
jgi:hypothetical protein